MKKVVTFGEMMLRLEPDGYLRFLQATSFGAIYAGTEANVAISLANYGIDSRYVTKLPTHEVGQAAVNTLRQYGVDTGFIARGGERIGIYFLEKGASQRGSNVIYDRAGSAISKACASDFDWDAIFDGADWFHFTGVTPALGDNVADICLEACKKAKEKGLTVSCDLNYRNKLWSKEKAREVMTELCKYVDVCISSEDEASAVLNIQASDDKYDKVSGKLTSEGYKDVAKLLTDKFGFKKVALIINDSISADDKKWSGMIYDGKDHAFSKEYSIHVVDGIGGGDSFGAGLIYSLISDYDLKAAIEFAAAAGCLKYTIEGDFNLASVDEVLRLADGDGAGSMKR